MNKKIILSVVLLCLVSMSFISAEDNEYEKRNLNFFERIINWFRELLEISPKTNGEISPPALPRENGEPLTTSPPTLPSENGNSASETTSGSIPSPPSLPA
jgi:hypothetical protein